MDDPTLIRETGEGYQMAQVPMEPFAKARPRVTANGTYMPKSYQAARKALRTAFGAVTVRSPWIVRVTAVRQMPASWSHKRRAGMDGTWCLTKPDIDNIVAGVLDALFEEDSAVVSVSGMKLWGTAHEIKVEVWSAT
jgi:Holliday junction resolvase RusA-like endonuclease